MPRQRFQRNVQPLEALVSGVFGDGVVVVALVVVDLFLPVAQVQIGDPEGAAEEERHVVLVREPEDHIEKTLVLGPGGGAGILGGTAEAALLVFGQDDENVVHADGLHHAEILFPLLQP